MQASIHLPVLLRDDNHHSWKNTAVTSQEREVHLVDALEHRRESIQSTQQQQNPSDYASNFSKNQNTNVDNNNKRNYFPQTTTPSRATPTISTTRNLSKMMAEKHKHEEQQQQRQRLTQNQIPSPPTTASLSARGKSHNIKNKKQQPHHSSGFGCGTPRFAPGFDNFSFKAGEVVRENIHTQLVNSARSASSSYGNRRSSSRTHSAARGGGGKGGSNIFGLTALSFGSTAPITFENQLNNTFHMNETNVTTFSRPQTVDTNISTSSKYNNREREKGTGTTSLAFPQTSSVRSEIDRQIWPSPHRPHNNNVKVLNTTTNIVVSGEVVNPNNNTDNNNTNDNKTMKQGTTISTSKTGRRYSSASSTAINQQQQNNARQRFLSQSAERERARDIAEVRAVTKEQDETMSSSSDSGSDSDNDFSNNNNNQNNNNNVDTSSPTTSHHKKNHFHRNLTKSASSSSLGVNNKGESSAAAGDDSRYRALQELEDHQQLPFINIMSGLFPHVSSEAFLARYIDWVADSRPRSPVLWTSVVPMPEDPIHNKMRHNRNPQYIGSITHDPSLFQSFVTSMSGSSVELSEEFCKTVLDCFVEYDAATFDEVVKIVSEHCRREEKKQEESGIVGGRRRSSSSSSPSSKTQRKNSGDATNNNNNNSLAPSSTSLISQGRSMYREAEILARERTNERANLAQSQSQFVNYSAGTPASSAASQAMGFSQRIDASSTDLSATQQIMSGGIGMMDNTLGDASLLGLSVTAPSGAFDSSQNNQNNNQSQTPVNNEARSNSEFASPFNNVNPSSPGSNSTSSPHQSPQQLQQRRESQPGSHSSYSPQSLLANANANANTNISANTSPGGQIINPRNVSLLSIRDVFRAFTDATFPPLALRNVMILTKFFDPHNIGAVPHYAFTQKDFLLKYFYQAVPNPTLSQKANWENVLNAFEQVRSEAEKWTHRHSKPLLITSTTTPQRIQQQLMSLSNNDDDNDDDSSDTNDEGELNESFAEHHHQQKQLLSNTTIEQSMPPFTWFLAAFVGGRMFNTGSFVAVTKRPLEILRQLFAKHYDTLPAPVAIPIEDFRFLLLCDDRIVSILHHYTIPEVRGGANAY